MMISKMSRLGSLLFGIIFLLIIGGIVLVFTKSLSHLSAIALIAVIVLLCTILISYILYDLYLLKQEQYLKKLIKEQE